MKKTLSFISLSVVLFAASCGPAAENREVMHARAKTISDSMANLIKTAMQEAEMPQVVVAQPDTNAAKNNTAAANTK